MSWDMIAPAAATAVFGIGLFWSIRKSFAKPEPEPDWIAAAPFRTTRTGADGPKTAHIRPVAGKSGESGSGIGEVTRAALERLAKREAMR